MSPDFSALWHQLSARPANAFLRSPFGTVNYGQLTELITRFCAAFDNEGAIPGSRVVIVSTNEPIAGAAFLAAMLDGLVPVMLSPDSRPDRISSICSSVESTLLIVDEPLADTLATCGKLDVKHIPIARSYRVENARSGMSALGQNLIRRFRKGNDGGSLGLPVSGRAPGLPVADDTPAYILFTSGTTKAPSGVVVSRKSVLAHLETLSRLFEYSVQSRIFNATPLAHTDGLVQGLLLAGFNGATLLRPGPFSLPDLEEWLNNLGRFEATHFITNPTTLTLIDRFATHADYFDDPNFFGILSSAAILRQSLWEKFESRFGCQLYNMYGMTETVANATYAGRHPAMGPVGTIGIPVDCEVRLMGVGHQELDSSARAEGEIQVRGENIFLEYWKDPARTAETLIEDGWMRTGDLARRREDGGLEIVGRIKTMINMGGQSVLPEEIDEVLVAHPAVVDVATVGLSDPEFEEVAVSAVVLAQMTTEAELTEHCRLHLERLKVPKRIIALEKIPRGDAGKPRTGELRDLLAPLLTSTSAVAVVAEQGSSSVSEEKVYEMAAQVFRVPAGTLNAGSSPATIPGWDSFTQLSLIMEAELRFDVNISASRIAGIRTLGDLHQTIIERH